MELSDNIESSTTNRLLLVQNRVSYPQTIHRAVLDYMYSISLEPSLASIEFKE